MKFRKNENNNPDSFRRVEILGVTAKQRQAKRVRINFRPLKSIFYILVLVAVVYFLGFSQYFKIKNIEMEGIKSVEVSDHLQRTLVGKNILFFLPGQYLNDLIRKFPILEQAKIVRGLPSTVRIIASERVQVLIWCTDRCFNIDNYGYAYETTTPITGQVVLNDKSGIPVEIGDKVTSPEFINFYLNALERLRGMNLTIIDSRIEETSFKLVFRASDNYDMVFDTSESITNQLSALQQVLDKNRADIKEYVDLRVEGLVYIK